MDSVDRSEEISRKITASCGANVAVRYEWREDVFAATWRRVELKPQAARVGGETAEQSLGRIARAWIDEIRGLLE